MPNNSPAVIAAQLFAKTGDRSVLAGHTPWALEDELMAYAKANARPGECDAAALTRLAREDETAKALARAAYHAEQAMHIAATPAQQLAAFRKHLGVDAPPTTPDTKTSAGVYAALEKAARLAMQPNEDFYTAFDRLAKNDETFAAVVRLYDELQRTGK